MAANVKAPVSKGTVKVAFNNTPQAQDDHLNLDITKPSQFLDILGNDGGGNAATLWAVGGGSFDQDWLLDNSHNTATSQYGATIRIDGKGVDYSIDSEVLAAKIQALAEGETLVDSFTYAIRLGNGTLSWATTYVTITGVNDAATIDGTKSGDVAEDGAIQTASGQLTVHDVDHGEAVFRAVDTAALQGTYGSFTFDASSGAWTYTLANDSEAVQALAQGETRTDTLTVVSKDGTANETITVQVHGTNDIAQMSADNAVDLKEDSASYVQSGTITVSDVDHGENGFGNVAKTEVYGSWTFDSSTGEWTYTLNNGDTAVQALNTGETRDDTLTVYSADGSAHTTITAHVHGTDEPVNINVTYVPEVPGESYMVQVPVETTTTTTTSGTDTFGTPHPAISGNANLNGQWTSWQNALNQWRTAEYNKYGADTDPTKVSTEYVYASGGSQTHVPVSYDVTYSWTQTTTTTTTSYTTETHTTDPVPAYLQLGNDAFVSFNDDTQLIFNIDAGDHTLAQLEALTKVALADIDGEGALDTVILFGDGRTLTLFNAGADNLEAIQNHITIA